MAKNDFILEVQPEDQAEQKILNEKLFDIEQKKRRSSWLPRVIVIIPLQKIEKLMKLCLPFKRMHKITDPDRFTFGDCRVHIRTPDEMLEIFKDHEDAVWNSGKIADMCNFKFETGKLFFPQFEIPARIYPRSLFYKHYAKRVLMSFLMTNVLIQDQEEIYQERLES